ncbi:MAG: [LysW]-aminoadipate/[LysW]-glutamate kinase [Desulfurococcales archaeon]|nr:[LysW]-aminoadipate/[LysW]-glutamate kinase [Desulfurococcales archaeon]
MQLVVKVGGRTLEANAESVVQDVASVVKDGHSLVLVHGGGSKVTEYCIKLGVETKFITHPSGVRSRYTSEDELRVYVMVMAGLINKFLVSRLVKEGVKAFGVSGADGTLLKARRRERILIIDERGRKRVIRGGYTGEVREVNTEIINVLLNSGYLPIIAPIAINESGTLLNVDADQVAFNIAKSVKADKLILLTDVEGVFLDGELLKEIRTSELNDLLSKIGRGMNRKLVEASRACEAGIKEVVISNGLTEHPLRDALMGAGTRITCG